MKQIVVLTAGVDQMNYSLFCMAKGEYQSTYFDKTPRGYEVQCFNYYCNVVMHLLIKQFCFLLIDFKHIFLFYFDYCILYNKKLDQSNII